MKILIEGIDGTGKSTLAETLSNRLEIFNVKHLGKPVAIKRYYGCKIRYQKEVFKRFNAIVNSEINVVYDRAHLGEFIYGPLYRGEACTTLENVENGFENQDVALVLMTVDNLSLLRDDGENFDTSNQSKEQEMFKDVFKKSKIENKILIKIDKDGEFRDLDEIKREVLMRLRMKTNGKKRFIPRTAHSAADADYLATLSPEDRDWYLNAEEVIYDCNFDNPLAELLNDEAKQDLVDEAQGKRRCVMTRGLSNLYEEREHYENLVDTREDDELIELAKLGMGDAIQEVEVDLNDMVFAGLMNREDADLQLHQAKNVMLADEKKMLAKRYSKLTKAEIRAKQRDNNE